MATQLDKLKLLEIRLALEDLNVDFAYHLDHNNVDQLIALFTEDAVYTHGERRSEGRDAIAQLFSKRLASGPRTSRHMSTGLKLDIESEVKATGKSVCMTFAQDGVPPITPATPFLVADFSDVYVCINDRWLIQQRHITRIFTDTQNQGPVGLKK